MSARARRTWLVAAAVVLVVAAIAVWRGTAAPGGAAASPTAGTPSATSTTSPGTPSASPSQSAAATPARPSSSPTRSGPAAPPEKPSAAPLDDEVTPAKGVTATVDRIERVSGKGSGPGEIDGPAVRFRVTLDNGTSRDVSLVGTVVNAYFGPAETPAIQLSEPAGEPFPQEVAAGRSATGTFVFLLPADESPMTVELFLSGRAEPVRWSGEIPSA